MAGESREQSQAVDHLAMHFPPQPTPDARVVRYLPYLINLTNTRSTGNVAPHSLRA